MQENLAHFGWASLWRDPVRRRHFSQGARAVLPGVVSTIIWGLVAGVAIGKAPLGLDVQLGIIFLVYSGTAQLAALPMMTAGAALSALAITATLVSLRFVLYSALVERHFHFLGRGQRLVVGFLTIDSGLAAFSAQDTRDWTDERRFAFFAGCNLPVWLGWSSGCVLGLLFAGLLPAGPEWAFMARLAIMALLVPLLRSRLQWIAMISGGLLAVLLTDEGLNLLQLPGGIGMFVAVTGGAACAMLVARWGARQ